MPNKPKKVWYLCEHCKRPFLTEARNLRRGQGRFCGRSCVGRWWATQPDFSFNRDQTGPANPNWRGGRTLHRKGYVYRYAPEHPRASNGYVFEHILVAENKLGRYLLPGETVHHKNHKRDDNRPGNIRVFDSPGAHTKYHAALRRKEATK